jgi:hypothetical protein
MNYMFDEACFDVGTEWESEHPDALTVLLGAFLGLGRR